MLEKHVTLDIVLFKRVFDTVLYFCNSIVVLKRGSCHCGLFLTLK